MSIEKKPNQPFINLLLFFARQITNRRTKLIVERDDTKDIKGPYLILANHVHNWDPIFINLVVKDPISFIAAESLFRIPLLKNVLEYIGIIPKMKSQNDTRTIRSIIKAKKSDRIIGIFPEGNRNWDGVTAPMNMATAKLAKMLNIPVVIGTIKGGHLSHPRWADKHRKGSIYISLVKAFDTDAFKKDSAEIVLEKLSSYFYYDEMAWQKEQQIAYPIKGAANYLERLLFICPHCKNAGKLYSEDDLFQCKQCHYIVKYTAYGYFEAVNLPLLHDTTHEWNKWQLDYVTENLQDIRRANVMLEDEVKLCIAGKNKSLKFITKGKLTLCGKQQFVEFHLEGKQSSYRFELNQMEGLNVHLHHMLDFFVDETMYRFEFFNPRTSAYKWLTFIDALLINDMKENNK